MSDRFVRPPATRVRSSKFFLAPSMTKQAHKDECDINLIIRKYDKTGVLTHVNRALATYGDFSAVHSFQEAHNSVMAAAASFADLPAKIRKEFDNDPAKFLDFIDNPENIERMYELGLAVRPVVDPEVVPAAPEEPSGDVVKS